MKVFMDFEKAWADVLAPGEDGSAQTLSDLRVKFQKIHTVGGVLFSKLKNVIMTFFLSR